MRITPPVTRPRANHDYPWRIFPPTAKLERMFESDRSEGPADDGAGPGSGAAFGPAAAGARSARAGHGSSRSSTPPSSPLPTSIPPGQEVPPVVGWTRLG